MYTNKSIVKLLEEIRQEHPSKLKLFKAVYEGRATQGKCIKAYCLDCQGLSTVAVRECNTQRCPLWRFRPYQAKRSAKVKSPPTHLT